MGVKDLESKIAKKRKELSDIAQYSKKWYELNSEIAKLTRDWKKAGIE